MEIICAKCKKGENKRAYVKDIMCFRRINYGALFLKDDNSAKRMYLCPDCFCNFEKMVLTWLTEPPKENDAE